MADSVRTLRVAELLKHEIAGIIVSDVHDPRVHDVVITKVKVTKDLSIARVYFSSYDRKSMLDIQIGLDKSKGFIRKRLMEKVHLKKLPSIIFEQDDTLEGAAKLDEIFARIHSKDEQ